jgi:HlyD family type I secretion membrane fusion protein
LLEPIVLRLFRLIARAWGRRSAPLIAAASRWEWRLITHVLERLDAGAAAPKAAPASLQARLIAAERAMDRAMDSAERHMRQAPAHVRAFVRAAKARREPARAALVHLGGTVLRRAMPAVRWAMHPRASRPVVLSAAALGAAGVVLAAFAPVERLAIGSGRVLDDGASLTLSHPEGGALLHIAVTTGQEVRAGDVLFRLEPRAAAGDAQAVRLRAARLAMAKARLTALMDGVDAPAFSSDADLDPQRARLELARFQTDRGRLDRSLRALDEAARGARARMDNLQQELAALRVELTGVAQSGRPTQTLSGDVLVMRAQWRFATVNRDLERARMALSQAETQRTEKLTEMRREWSAELARISEELETLDAALLRLADRASEFEIRAPAGGRVLWMTHHEIGAGVAANEVLVQILPSDAELVAEVWGPALDMRHVRVGDPVRVRLEAGPDGAPAAPVRGPEGVINGIVKWIDAPSPGVIDRDTHHRVLVALTQSVEDVRPLDVAVSPGASVHAEIVVSQVSGAPRIAGWFAAQAMPAH